MTYNKKNQPYMRLGTFALDEVEGRVEYARVRFFNTNHVQVVRLQDEMLGRFEDESLIKEETEKEFIPEAVITLTEPTIAVKVSEEQPVEEKTFMIATDKKKVEYTITDLESFCKDKKLDIEAVKLCLEGKQKSHRGWRFEVK